MVSIQASECGESSTTLTPASSPLVFARPPASSKTLLAGRLLLCYLIHLSTTVRRLYHHIHLNSEARADIRWWNSFLPSWNGISMFISPNWNYAESIQLYTDTSGSCGFGATWMGPGSEATGSHTSNYPNGLYSGKNYLP